MNWIGEEEVGGEEHAGDFVTCMAPGLAARLAIWTDVFVVECVRGVRFVDLGFDALLNWERAMPAITWVSALGGLLVVGAAVVVVIQAAKGKSGGDR